MLTSEEIAAAREDMAAELLDTVTVWADTGATILDEVTFEELPVWAKVYNQIPALVVIEVPRDRPHTEAGEPIIVRVYVVTLTVDRLVESGHIIVVDASHDDATQAAVMTVRGQRHGSLSISRKVVAQENLTVPRFVPEGA